MTVLRVAAVQASYVLMDRDATIDRVAALTDAAAREGWGRMAGTPVER
jgi:predicted amidohydrolase